MNVFS